MRFRLRTMFLITAAVACILGALVFVQGIIDFVEQDAAKRHLEEGTISRDQARQWVGDVVDQWPDTKQPTD